MQITILIIACLALIFSIYNLSIKGKDEQKLLFMIRSLRKNNRDLRKRQKVLNDSNVSLVTQAVQLSTKVQNLQDNMNLITTTKINQVRR